MPNGNEPIARDTGRAFGPFGRHLGHEVSMKERMQQLLSGIKSQIQYAPEEEVEKMWGPLAALDDSAPGYFGSIVSTYPPGEFEQAIGMSEEVIRGGIGEGLGSLAAWANATLEKGIPETRAQQRVGSRTYPGPR